MWDLFGDNTGAANRPFGSAIVDGFDFDFEATTNNLAPFAQQLRSKIDASGRKMYLSAAPQCVYPDAAMNDVLNGAVALDFIMIQFYNNFCSVASFEPGSEEQTNYNFKQWDDWAKASANPDVKVLVGAPGNTGAAGSGYVGAEQLAAVLEWSKKFDSFGGAMIWDMSQVWDNAGFLETIFSSL